MSVCAAREPFDELDRFGVSLLIVGMLHSGEGEEGGVG